MGGQSKKDISMLGLSLIWERYRVTLHYFLGLGKKLGSLLDVFRREYEEGILSIR